MLRTFLFIPGILQKPSRVDDWDDAAKVWINTHTEHKADAYPYNCPALLRWWGQANRVADVERLVHWYGGETVVSVDHSNGCEIAVRMLREGYGRKDMAGYPIPDVRVDRLYLIAGACDADFEKNGLNLAVKRGQVNGIRVFASRQDSVLKNWAPLSKKLGGIFGLGYGNLGYEGPQNMSRAANLITDTTWFEGFGHSTYLNTGRLEQTLEMITGEVG